MAAIRIGIAGAGRMGRSLARAIDASSDLVLVDVWRRGKDIDEVLASSDVLIDFSLPEATDVVIAAAVRRQVPLVCGVSGLGDEQIASLGEAAKTIAVVYDRNMSLGVAVLENIARQAAAALGPEFEVEVHEAHHMHKLDAPSGTALKLGEAIAETLGTNAADIHYESERRGEVPGDHTVILSSPTERLSLGHSVTTRDVFAEGALRAARWITGAEPGLYSIHDVLS